MGWFRFLSQYFNFSDTEPTMYIKKKSLRLEWIFKVCWWVGPEPPLGKTTELALVLWVWVTWTGDTRAGELALLLLSSTLELARAVLRACLGGDKKRKSSCWPAQLPPRPRTRTMRKSTPTSTSSSSFTVIESQQYYGWTSTWFLETAQTQTTTWSLVQHVPWTSV